MRFLCVWVLRASVTINSIVVFRVVDKWDKPTIELIVKEQSVLAFGLLWLAFTGLCRRFELGCN